MSTIPLDDWLIPLSSDAPCGDDLEYDSDFQALEQAAQKTPGQEYGNTKTPEMPPNWPEVLAKAKLLFTRTKDLRIAVYLARALLNEHGMMGLHDGLLLLEQWLTRYWPTIHPQLDPDDQDPTARLNSLMALCHPETMLLEVRKAPLIDIRGLGRFSLYDVEVATGLVKPTTGEPTVDKTSLEAAFRETPPETLQTTRRFVREAAASVQTIENFLTNQLGTQQAVSFDPLLKLLREADRVLTDQLQRRGIAAEPPFEDKQMPTPPEVMQPSPETMNATLTAPVRTGPIQSREQVIEALDQICTYYTRYEPSSPVPLLLQRAKRLASMSFIEIMQDLAPTSVTQIEQLSGGNKAASTGT